MRIFNIKILKISISMVCGSFLANGKFTAWQQRKTKDNLLSTHSPSVRPRRNKIHVVELSSFISRHGLLHGRTMRKSFFISCRILSVGSCPSYRSRINERPFASRRPSSITCKGETTRRGRWCSAVGYKKNNLRHWFHTKDETSAAWAVDP